MSSAKVALRIESLRKSYPGTLAVKNLSMQVGHRTIHGFLGPNGAGKSTTMKAIMGLLQFDSGKVQIFDHDLSSVRSRLFSLVGYLPEQVPLYEYMQVREFLDFVFQIYSTKPNKKFYVETAIERCGLEQVQKKYISQLSKGFRQRTGLAMAMVHGPDLLILDEPFVGLDPIALSELRNVLVELKKDHTILFSSHQLDEVKRLCDNLTVIDQGETVFNGSLSQFLHKSPQVKIRAVLMSIEESQISLLKKSIRGLSVQSVIAEGQNKVLTIELDNLKQKTELSQFFAMNMIPVLEFGEIETGIESMYQESIHQHQEVLHLANSQPKIQADSQGGKI